MIDNDLLTRLRSLNRDEKREVVRILNAELAEQNGIFSSDIIYPIVSPPDSYEAAQTLMEIMEEYQANKN